MAFSGGVFSRIHNWVSDLTNGIDISASRMDQEMDGFADGLSNCILKDGTQTVTANIPMNSKKFTGLGDPSATGDSVHYGWSEGRYARLGDATNGRLAANLLINSYGDINQRVTSNGALSAGIFLRDRWKASTGGATASVSSGLFTITSGAIEQVIENGFLLKGGLASQTICIAVNDLTGGSLTISAGAAGSGTITAGSGVRSTTITLGAGDTGNITVKFAGTGVSFRYPRVARGSAPAVIDEGRNEGDLCLRYYQKSLTAGSAPGTVALAGLERGGSQSGGAITYGCRFPMSMRTSPTVRVWDIGGNLGLVTTNSSGGVSLSRIASAANIIEKGFDISIVTSDVAMLFHWDADAEI